MSTGFPRQEWSGVAGEQAVSIWWCGHALEIQLPARAEGLQEHAGAGDEACTRDKFLTPQKNAV